MKLRRLSGLVLGLVAAMTLAGCAGLPTGGSVHAGLPADEQIVGPDVSFVPDRPQPGASPEQIIEGFIRAGSGTADNWGIARLYLAPEAQSWKPDAGVTVVVAGDRLYSEPEEGAVTVSLNLVASVDATGAYEVAESGPTVLSFRLAEQADGEWRITKAPDGVILDENVFPRIYHAYSLMFFDPSWHFLVPDVRWFPRTNPATRIAKALVAGPAPWLASSVSTAFPDGLGLASPSVPVVSGIAQIELGTGALQLDAETLSRMQAQFQESLSTALVSGVQMSVAGAPLSAVAAPTRSTRVNAPPLVQTDKDFGFLAGEAVEPIPGLSAAIMGLSPAPVSIQVGPDRDFAAVRLQGGGVYRVDSAGAVVLMDGRPGLIDPTVGPLGYTWSVPGDAPTTLIAFDPTGKPNPLATAWGAASQVSAIALSHDGTRLAAVVVTGGRSAVWIAGVERDKDAAGVPRSLGEVQLLSLLPGPGIGLAWLDDTTVGVLVASGEQRIMVEQPVGGPTVPISAPAGVASIAGANLTTTVRLRGADGELFSRRGTNWQQTSEGIKVLATQQGSPQ